MKLTYKVWTLTGASGTRGTAKMRQEYIRDVGIRYVGDVSLGNCECDWTMVDTQKDVRMHGGTDCTLLRGTIDKMIDAMIEQY